MDVQINKVRFTGKAAGSVLLTLAAALALWLFIAANFRRTATAEIFRSLVTINSHKAGEIAAWVRLHRREAERFSRHPFLGEIISAEQAKPGSRRARLDAWIKEYASQEQAASMALLSPKGAVIAGTPGYRAGTEKHFTEAFARASLEGKAGLTDLYLAADGRPRMTMLSPISAGGRGGRTQCVLVINIDPGTEFYPLLNAQPQFFKNVESLLVRVEDGHLLALNDVEGKSGSALRLRRPLSDKGLPKARAVKDLAAGYHDAGIDHRGVKIFRAASPVDGTDWALATNIDRDTILAPVKTRERLALALILLASGLIYTAAYFILRSGRTAAAAALEKNRHLLAETEQIGKVGGWEYNIDTGELLCTAEVCRIHELPPDHKFDLNRDTSFYTPASRPLIERAMRRAIENGEGFDLELEILTAGGNLRAVHVIARPDKGNRRVYGFFQDITERKQAEEKLRESEERLRVTLEVTQIGTWDWNVETDTWSASPTYYTMLGYDPEQGPGDRQAWLNRVHPDDKDMIAAKISGVLAGTKDRYQYEARIRHADGTYRWQAVLGRTVKSGENGKAARIMGVRMDITEQKLAAERLARLSDMVPGVVYQYRLYPDGRSCFPYSSSGMNEIYEVTPEEVRLDATPVFGRLHPEDLKGTSEAIFASARDNSIFHWEFRVVLPRQGLRWRMCDARPERQPDGGTLWYGIITDITERRRAEMELEKLNRDLVAKRQEMENFLYITSHDLRTPLVNIQGFTQNLERYLSELKEELSPARLRQPVEETISRLTGKEIPEALKFVLESSHKMDSLINSLLKVARLGRVEMKPGNLEMNDLLRRIVDSTSYRLEAAGGTAKIGVLPPCKADPAAVSQIFANLLENAIKYRAEGRALAVTITGETRGASVLYKVADNGSGIAAKELGRIWDIFYRGAGAKEGEGIGLTVVKYMAEKNGGRVRAESEEGRGTVFYLELPAAGGTK